MTFPQPLKVERYAGQPCRWAQVKHDGWRLTVHRTARGVRCLSNTGAEIFGLDVCPWFKRMRGLPAATMIEGEMCAPGRPATDVPSLLASNPAALAFTAFALPVYAGHDLSDYGLPEVDRIVRAHGLAFSDYMVCVGPLSEPRQRWLLDAMPPGQEGWVLKASNYAGWYKLKPVQTIDAVVTEVLPGSLAVSVWSGGRLVELACVKHKGNPGDVGRVVEVGYQGIGSRGRLRGGRFIRWREDKLAAACTADQDPDLAARQGNHGPRRNRAGGIVLSLTA